MRQNPKTVSPMSNEGRNAYVIEHITESFLDLLSKKPVSEISISELCERAGVGRASFYRNFGSKEDILKIYIDKIFREWTDEFAKNEDIPLNQKIKAMFGHFENHRDFYKILNERGLVYLLKDVIIGIFDLKLEDSKIEAYSKAFVAYSLYGWIEVWFQRGMQESAEEMADLFKKQGL